MISQLYSTYIKTCKLSMHFTACQLQPNKAERKTQKLTEKSPLLHLNHLPKDFSVKKKRKTCVYRFRGLINCQGGVVEQVPFRWGFLTPSFHAEGRMTACASLEAERYGTTYADFTKKMLIVLESCDCLQGRNVTGARARVRRHRHSGRSQALLRPPAFQAAPVGRTQ